MALKAGEVAFLSRQAPCGCLASQSNIL